jgi:AcrR family transcriptional regulator
VAAPPAKTPRRAATEAGVLSAAGALIDEGVSYADLNVERIARRAGISRTAFYFYFRDKRELLVRLTGEVSEELLAAAERWWNEGGGPDALESSLADIVRLYLEHTALLRAVVEASSADAELATFWRELIGRFVEGTQKHITAEQESGQARAAPPADGTAFALCWMTERTLYEHVVQRRGTDPQPLIESLLGVWRATLYST